MDIWETVTNGLETLGLCLAVGLELHRAVRERRSAAARAGEAGGEGDADGETAG